MDIYTCICINTRCKRSTLNLKPDILRCHGFVSFVLPDVEHVIIYNICFKFLKLFKAYMLGLWQQKSYILYNT